MNLIPALLSIRLELSFPWWSGMDAASPEPVRLAGKVQGAFLFYRRIIDRSASGGQKEKLSRLLCFPHHMK